MGISYNKLWKLMRERNMKKKDLKERAEISQNVIARLGKGQSVAIDSLAKICMVFQCDIGDVMEFVPDRVV